MKVITLKQPWATLVAEGLKQYEFRSWKINYRGKILIHAGQGIDEEGMERVKNLNLKFPKSRIVAEVTIDDCILLDQEINKKIINENKIVYGEKYDRTGYAWKLTNIKKINSKVEVKGKQGFWNINEKDY